MKPERVRCCVPGCRRTFKRRNPDSWDETVMCGRHWRLAPKRLRRRSTRLLRAYNAAKDGRRARRLATLYNRNWNRCRRLIEADVLAGFDL